MCHFVHKLVARQPAETLGSYWSQLRDNPTYNPPVKWRIVVLTVQLFIAIKHRTYIVLIGDLLEVNFITFGRSQTNCFLLFPKLASSSYIFSVLDMRVVSIFLCLPELSFFPFSKQCTTNSTSSSSKMLGYFRIRPLVFN